MAERLKTLEGYTLSSFKRTMNRQNGTGPDVSWKLLSFSSDENYFHVKLDYTLTLVACRIIDFCNIDQSIKNDIWNYDGNGNDDGLLRVEGSASFSARIDAFCEIDNNIDWFLGPYEDEVKNINVSIDKVKWETKYDDNNVDRKTSKLIKKAAEEYLNKNLNDFENDVTNNILNTFYLEKE